MHILLCIILLGHFNNNNKSQFSVVEGLAHEQIQWLHIWSKSLKYIFSIYLFKYLNAQLYLALEIVYRSVQFPIPAKYSHLFFGPYTFLGSIL